MIFHEWPPSFSSSFSLFLFSPPTTRPFRPLLSFIPPKSLPNPLAIETTVFKICIFRSVSNNSDDEEEDDKGEDGEEDDGGDAVVFVRCCVCCYYISITDLFVVNRR